MAFELGKRTADIAPFGESLAPPCIVFRDRMKLRQIKRDQLGRKRFRQRGRTVWDISNRCFVAADCWPARAAMAHPAACRFRDPVRMSIQKPAAPAVACCVTQRYRTKSCAQEAEHGCAQTRLQRATGRTHRFW